MKRKTLTLTLTGCVEVIGDCPSQVLQRRCPFCSSPYIITKLVFISRTKDISQTYCSRNRVLCCWLKVLQGTAGHIIQAETMQHASKPLTDKICCIHFESTVNVDALIGEKKNETLFNALFNRLCNWVYCLGKMVISS